MLLILCYIGIFLLQLIEGGSINIAGMVGKPTKLELDKSIVHFTDSHAIINMQKPLKDQILRIGLCRVRSRRTKLWRLISRTSTEIAFEKDCVRAKYNHDGSWILIDVQNSNSGYNSTILDARPIRKFYVGLFGSPDRGLVSQSSDFQLIIDYNNGDIQNSHCDSGVCRSFIKSMHKDMRYIAIVKNEDGSKVLHRVLGTNDLSDSSVTFKFAKPLEQPCIFEIVQRKVWWKSYFADSTLIYRQWMSGDTSFDDPPLSSRSSYSVTLATREYYNSVKEKEELQRALLKSPVRSRDNGRGLLDTLADKPESHPIIICEGESSEESNDNTCLGYDPHCPLYSSANDKSRLARSDSHPIDDIYDDESEQNDEDSREISSDTSSIGDNDDFLQSQSDAEPESESENESSYSDEESPMYPDAQQSPTRMEFNCLPELDYITPNLKIAHKLLKGRKLWMRKRGFEVFFNQLQHYKGNEDFLKFRYHILPMTDHLIVSDKEERTMRIIQMRPQVITSNLIPAEGPLNTCLLDTRDDLKYFKEVSAIYELLWPFPEHDGKFKNPDYKLRFLLNWYSQHVSINVINPVFSRSGPRDRKLTLADHVFWEANQILLHPELLETHACPVHRPDSGSEQMFRILRSSECQNLNNNDDDNDNNDTKEDSTASTSTTITTSTSTGTTSTSTGKRQRRSSIYEISSPNRQFAQSIHSVTADLDQVRIRLRFSPTKQHPPPRHHED